MNRILITLILVSFVQIELLSQQIYGAKFAAINMKNDTVVLSCFPTKNLQEYCNTMFIHKKQIELELVDTVVNVAFVLEDSLDRIKLNTLFKEEQYEFITIDSVELVIDRVSKGAAGKYSFKIKLIE